MPGMSQSETQHPEAAPGRLPAWITPELIAETLRVWQPYYREELTTDGAVEILEAASGLLSVLTRRTTKSELIDGPQFNDAETMGDSQHNRRPSGPRQGDRHGPGDRID